ncbi:MAG: hypothetical protein U0457_15055 [Candidatus Sericytochromatia bacterium]
MFDFLEVDDNSPKEKHYQEVKKEIPDNQYLVYSDLLTLEPDKKVVNLILPSILKKYTIIPLFIMVGNTKPTLPKHLENQFWGHIDGDKNTLTVYIACPNPFDIQILNMIKNITKYTVIALPLNKIDGEKYLNDKLFPKKEVPKKENNSIIFLKNNYIYIILVFIIVFSLYGLKILIEK